MDYTDLIKYEPKPSDWFTPNIEYKGIGRAKFEKPGGILTGNALATFNEYGEYEVVLLVDEVIYPDGQVHDYFDFLGIGGLDHNKCNEIIIYTVNGTLTVRNDIFFSPNLSIGSQEPDSRELKVAFHFNVGVFQTKEFVSPKYWVLPLSNFISDFFQKTPELTNHPLRLIPTPELPSDISPDKKDIAVYIANQKNRLIVFKFNNDDGFIEPLHDYDDRKSKLVSGKVRNLLTSIMVGNIGGFPFESWEELEKWFPIDFLCLLGIATGSEVGSRTIEIRGENAELVRRIHINLGTPTYVKGHKAIDEVIHRGGIGLFLSKATLSEHWGKSYLRVLLRHIIRGGYTEQAMLEERFLFLCLAIETLAKQLGYESEDLITNLNPNQKEDIYSIIQTARLKILELSKPQEIETNERRVIERIAHRVMSSVQKDSSFGGKIYKLLEHFHLLDAQVMDKHFKEHPRLDGIQTWGNVLSYYRGSAIHEGYFGLGTNRKEAIDILIMMKHLHDILLRMAFVMLDYDGNYDPTVSDYHDSRPKTWVTLDRTGEELGYRV